jgi:ABC-type uncharacterized transport system fused permease/ATPase subunit
VTAPTYSDAFTSAMRWCVLALFVIAVLILAGRLVSLALRRRHYNAAQRRDLVRMHRYEAEMKALGRR